MSSINSPEFDIRNPYLEDEIINRLLPIFASLTPLDTKDEKENAHEYLDNLAQELHLKAIGLSRKNANSTYREIPASQKKVTGHEEDMPDEESFLDAALIKAVARSVGNVEDDSVRYLLRNGRINELKSEYPHQPLLPVFASLLFYDDETFAIAYDQVREVFVELLFAFETAQ